METDQILIYSLEDRLDEFENTSDKVQSNLVEIQHTFGINYPDRGVLGIYDFSRLQPSD